MAESLFFFVFLFFSSCVTQLSSDFDIAHLVWGFSELSPLLRKLWPKTCSFIPFKKYILYFFHLIFFIDIKEALLALLSYFL